MILLRFRLLNIVLGIVSQNNVYEDVAVGFRTPISSLKKKGKFYPMYQTWGKRKIFSSISNCKIILYIQHMAYHKIGHNTPRPTMHRVPFKSNLDRNTSGVGVTWQHVKRALFISQQGPPSESQVRRLNIHFVFLMSSMSYIISLWKNIIKSMQFIH